MFGKCELSNAGSGSDDSAVAYSTSETHQPAENNIIGVSRLLAAMIEVDALECSEVAQ